MFLLIDKQKGITSHDVVQKIRRLTKTKKVGHAGTLDPNATGLLIIAIGRDSTKKLGNLTLHTTKEYEAEIHLGEVRDTYDAEGKIISKNDFEPTKETVTKAVKSFVGTSNQTPPIYSAIKLNGKKAYELARKGKDVVLKKRKITIHSIESISYRYPTLKFVVACSAGTYIRSLAFDIGETLTCGAYLKNLRRTKIGDFDVKDAYPLDSLTEKNIESYMISLEVS